jgi:hypothetical protein
MAGTKIALSAQDYGGAWAKDEASGAGVWWPAVFAGAFTIGALALILPVLGAGIGFSSVSPWRGGAAQETRLSAGAIIWLILVQLVSASIGGYLAGRLRTKWASLHTHEIYFRDTAPVFFAWAVALVISPLLFMSCATSIATRPTAASTENGVGTYFVDMLFRTDHPTAARTDQPPRSDAALILASALSHPDMTKQDQTYLADLVAAATGLSQGEAERRVAETVAADREAADTARKAIAHSPYWLFVAFLIGAFCASYVVTIGGVGNGAMFPRRISNLNLRRAACDQSCCSCSGYQSRSLS